MSEVLLYFLHLCFHVGNTSVCYDIFLGHNKITSMPIHLTISFLVSVPDYTPGEVQAQDMAPPIYVEENVAAEKYNTVEAPQQLSVADEILDEPQDIASYPVALETTRESPPTAPEEPAGEPTKHTYASIVC